MLICRAGVMVTGERWTMFTFNDLRTLLNARPFVPFRLWYFDGEHYDIRSPKHVLPLRQYVIVGLFDPNALEDAFDSHVVVWYAHVTRFELLTGGVSPSQAVER